MSDDRISEADARAPGGATTRKWVPLVKSDTPLVNMSSGVSRIVAPPPPYPPSVDGYGLGRLPAYDPRDAKYSMQRTLVAAGIGPDDVQHTSRTWKSGEIMDQGATPECVAYAWAGFLAASPTRTKVPQLAPLPDFASYSFTDGLYSACKQVDEWPGENYDGTSVRAGAKVLQRLGRLSTYLWAFDAETLRTYVLTRGPAVIGINWYDDMFDADTEGDRPLTVAVNNDQQRAENVAALLNRVYGA
jgi:hypothetical protein